jgi:hypothetical protein
MGCKTPLTGQEPHVRYLGVSETPTGLETALDKCRDLANDVLRRSSLLEPSITVPDTTMQHVQK